MARKSTKTIFATLGALAVGAGLVRPAAAQPVVTVDPSGDANIRRTDFGANGPINPQVQRLPDIIETRIGRFAPGAPAVDRFSGVWSVSGAFLRVDLVFDSLLNPPGPLDYDDANPQYDPFRYGPHPVYGFVEFDADGDEDTGGELNSPDFRYLGVVARNGGLPTETRFSGRVAMDGNDMDGEFTTPPFVERSGEEFHIAFLGEEVDEVQVIVEKPGGNPALFEVGEIWRLEGTFFHRSHGWEQFILTCPASEGLYTPSVQLLFSHDVALNTTTVSFVYPLTNASAAALVNPPDPVESLDGCDHNQNSIEEALESVRFSALFADFFDRLLPEFQLIAGWELKLVPEYLDPAGWRLLGNLGTAYATHQPDEARFIWTDVFPSVRTGDFNGDGMVNTADELLLTNFIFTSDGQPEYDTDGNSFNGILQLPFFAENFSLFDTNYDGQVRSNDLVMLGDMDINYFLSYDDVDDMVQALLDGTMYMATHGQVDPRIRGDINGDGALDGYDLASFVNLLTGGV